MRAGATQTHDVFEIDESSVSCTAAATAASIEEEEEDEEAVSIALSSSTLAVDVDSYEGHIRSGASSRKAQQQQQQEEDTKIHSEEAGKESRIPWTPQQCEAFVHSSALLRCVGLQECFVAGVWGNAMLKKRTPPANQEERSSNSQAVVLIEKNANGNVVVNREGDSDMTDDEDFSGVCLDPAKTSLYAHERQGGDWVRRTDSAKVVVLSTTTVSTADCDEDGGNGESHARSDACTHGHKSVKVAKGFSSSSSHLVSGVALRAILHEAIAACYAQEDALTRIIREEEDRQLSGASSGNMVDITNTKKGASIAPQVWQQRISLQGSSGKGIRSREASKAIGDVFVSDLLTSEEGFGGANGISASGSMNAYDMLASSTTFAAPSGADSNNKKQLSLVPQRLKLSTCATREEVAEQERRMQQRQEEEEQREALMAGYRKQFNQMRSAGVRRVREARESCDQATEQHRRRELPFLVSDALRYALLLVQFKQSETCTPSTSTVSSSSSSPPRVQPSSSSSTPINTGGSSNSNYVNTSTGNVQFGDPSLLLYGKYPPPLFTTTSFASETLRLLKWLRTWKVSECGATSGEGKGAIVSHVKSHNGAASSSSSSNSNNKAGSSLIASMAEDTLSLKQQKQQPEECLTRDESTKKLNQQAFIAFFGAAARQKKPQADAGSHGSIVPRSDMTHEKQAGKKRRRLRDESLEEASSPISPPRKGTRAIPALVDEGITSDDVSSVKVKAAGGAPHDNTPKQQEVEEEQDGTAVAVGSACPNAQAYAAYTQQWLEALAGGIPTATRGGTTDVVLATVKQQQQQQQQQQVHERLPTSRACAALPFFKEMQQEVEVLGSTGQVYCDAFGNRLRSARLAKIDAERRSMAEAEERKKERIKGYFARSGTGGGGHGEESSSPFHRMSDGGWSALRQSAGTGSLSDSEDDRNGGGAGAEHGGTHSNNSISSREEDDITNIAVVCGATGVGKTAAVYLAAQLLGFRVIELNASSRRCPKTVERVLAELTRSHRLSGLRQGKSMVSIEEELHKLKQEHAAVVERLAAEQAAEEAAEAKRKDARRKANAISAEAVANFFKPKLKAGPATSDAQSDTSKNKKQTKEDKVEVVEVTHIDGDNANDTSSRAGATASVPAEAQSPKGATSGSNTLLLIEDADVLLGDEALKPFYASLRDLACKSKVPIVVTTSTEPSSTARYGSGSSGGDGYSAAKSSRCRSIHSALELLASTTAKDENDVYAAVQAESERLYEDPAACLQHGSTFTQVPFTAALSAQHFGRQTPFARLEPLSSTALFAQLLIVGAVEEGILAIVQGDDTSNRNGSSSGSGGVFTSQIPQQVETQQHSAHCVSSTAKEKSLSTTAGHIKAASRALHEISLKAGDTFSSSGVQTGEAESTSNVGDARQSLVLTDLTRFLQLAQWLRGDLFGDHGADARREDGKETKPRCVTQNSKEQKKGRRAMGEEDELARLAALMAAQAFTTDVRFWLNKLQFYLLSAPSSVQATPSNDKERQERDEARVDHSDAHHGAMHTILRWSDADTASRWDTAEGRMLANLAYNDEHCPRQQRFLLETQLSYAHDILDELDTLDHPTLDIDYSTPSPDTPSFPTEPVQEQRRRGRPAKASKKEPASTAKSANAAVEGQNSFSRVPLRVTSALPTSTGGLSSDGSLSALFGLPRRPTAGLIDGGSSSAITSPTGQSATNITTSVLLRWQDRDLLDAFTQRPVSLLLPYSMCAQRCLYGGTLPTPSSASSPTYIGFTGGEAAGTAYYQFPCASLLHSQRARLLLELPRSLLFPPLPSAVCGMTPHGQLRIADEVCVHTQQESTTAARASCFRHWWKKAKKAEAAKVFVVAQSHKAYEDAVSFSVLLAPASTSSSSVLADLT